MEPLPAIQATPPEPRPLRLWERWRVSWHARRDAKLRRRDADLRGVATDLAQPYLESLRAAAEADQQAVSAWLHDTIVPLDREVARLCTVLAQYRRDPVSRPAPALVTPAPEHQPAPPQPTLTIPAWVVEARQATAARQAYERRMVEQNHAEQQLSQLGSIRHHLIEAARAAAKAHLARYEQLVGLYGAALRRRYRRRTIPDAHPRPPEVMTESWLHGDLPLLALAVDGEPSDSYGWFLKDFATRTSERRPPLPVEIPRAG